MKIPVENLYYLLCYAWDHLEARDRLAPAAVEAERPEDLFARLLLEGTRQVLRRGLDRGYVERSDDLSSPRGKMDVAVTGKRALLARPAVHCHFDELSHDVAHNRIVKAALKQIGQATNLAGDLRGEAVRISERFHDVSETPLTAQAFRRVQLHRNNAAYRFLMSLCELIARNLIPDPSSEGSLQLQDFTGSDQQMGNMFEEFVRSFLHREQTLFKIDRRQVPWDGGGLSNSDELRLPIMRTDVTLSSADEIVVIETKYSSTPLQAAWGGAPKVDSGHLYQLLSYVRNLAAAERTDRRIRGILLYAQASRAFNLQYRIHGHAISVRSLDLAQPWSGVRNDLLELAARLAEAA